MPSKIFWNFISTDKYII